MSQDIQQQIDQFVRSQPVVLFMKGTPELPQCGFSQRVVAILASYGIAYVAVNVLLDERVRQGIKEYADWPTIPQLYVHGKFVGGCDIVSEMHATGELAELLADVPRAAG